MKSTLKTLFSAAVIIATVSVTAGCSTIANLEAAAQADRAQHLEKYQEDQTILRQQLTANQNGLAYPQFCTWGCPKEQMDLTRSW